MRLRAACAAFLLLAGPGLARAQERQPPPHPLAQALEKLGATDCSAAAAKTASTFSPERRDVVVLAVPKDKPNDRQLSATLILPRPGKDSGTEAQDFAVLAMQLAPHQANGCDVSTQTITIEPEPCGTLLQKSRPDLVMNRIGNTAWLIGEISPSDRLLAAPVKDSCILLRLRNAG